MIFYFVCLIFSTEIFFNFKKLKEKHFVEVIFSKKSYLKKIFLRKNFVLYSRREIMHSRYNENYLIYLGENIKNNDIFSLIFYMENDEKITTQNFIFDKKNDTFKLCDSVNLCKIM